MPRAAAIEPRHAAAPSAPSPPDGPPPAADAVPKSPLERALDAAQQIDPDRTLEQAQADLTVATDQVANLQGTSWRESWASEARQALVAERRASVAVRYLTAGGRIAEEASGDVDSALVSAFVHIKGPGAVQGLLLAAGRRAELAEGTLAKLAMQVDALKEGYASGQLRLADFVPTAATLLGERAAVRAAEVRWRDSITAVHNRLRHAAGAALGDANDLRSSVRESVVMSSERDTQLAAWTSELSQIAEDLARLAGDDEAGRIAKALDERRVALNVAVSARKAELAKATRSSGSNLVERCVAGELAGLVELFNIAIALPAAFEAELPDRIVALLASSLAADPAVWAELV